VAGVPGFWVQTKHGKFISIRDALTQGEAELAESGRTDMKVLAVTRFNGERDVVSMRFGDFMLLLAELHYRREIGLEIHDAEELAANMSDFKTRITNEVLDGE
jgi:hypothetical protein